MRRRQLLGDAGMVAWTVLWVWIGLSLRQLIGRLAQSGRELEDAGRDLTDAGVRVGDRVEDLPLVGDALSAAFAAVTSTGQSINQAGTMQQDVVAALALWLPLVIAALPIGYVLLPYVVWRVRWSRDFQAAQRLRDQSGGAMELFALRALAHRPLRDLRRAEPDPHAAYRAGRYHSLGLVELRALGLRPPKE